jgi:Ca2+-binding EF-hand superfamily protein
MAEKDILVLLDHYCTANGDINIQALHDDVTENTSTAQPTFPKSELILRPDHAEWNQHDMSAVERVQARVVERRLRLMENFQDWDPLRKGYCTLGQLKTVFTLLKIDISQADFDQLASLYSRDDGQFCYAAFCSEVDQAFTVNGLEKAPLYTVEQHDGRTTLPARRSRIKLSPEQEDAIRQIEDQIRARTSTRRILLRTAFQDYDPVKRKHVTRGQFGRVMNTLGFQLDESAIDLLCLVYCDLGNHFEFNYLAFCQSCDAPTEDDVLAKNQQESAFQGKLPSQYFNARNRICKIDSMC